MAPSYHILLAILPLLSFVDVVLLSVRTLASQRYDGPDFCYAIMAVQESVLLVELLAVLAQLFTTYLLTTGMWGQVAALLSAYAPLWLLRVSLTVTTVVYKNFIHPRQASAAVFRGEPHFLPHFPRAWGAPGYGAVFSLDIACCFFYYLSAVYVLGYLSNETLYVPYHRRPWRHLQRKRAIAVATATDQDSRHTKQRKRQRWEQKERAAGATGDGGGWGVSGNPGMMSLTQTPSFLRWRANMYSEQGNVDHQGGTTDSGDHAQSHSLKEEFSRGEASHQSSAARASFEKGKNDGVHATTHIPGAHPATPGSPPHWLPTTPQKRSSDAVSAAAKPPRAAKQNHNKVSAPPDRNFEAKTQMQPTSVFTNLPPLQLHHRFTANGEGVEKQLHHFAKAVVAHGYTPTTSTSDKAAPGKLSSSGHTESTGAVGQHPTLVKQDADSPASVTTYTPHRR